MKRSPVVLLMALALGGLVSLMAASPSLAQKTGRDTKAADTSAGETPSQPPVTADPSMTTAAFGDWVLRCIRIDDGAASHRVCEVSQSLMMDGGQGTIAQIAIGRPAVDQPMMLTTVLPNNVAFPSTVRLLVEENDQAPLELSWTRCIPGACIAQLALDAAALERLADRDAGGQIGFTDANANVVLLPISLRGLAQAIDGLNSAKP